ncbi:Oidioi.mRNA.OKI2018_I69.chr2.g6902.t1.cds [Oikopleura dioica]|uniref:Oidioi.mRNA.OKI2018_I69.chr2.g6902.t1.cds n=1 Tax=Oikopleura dioica TaxID=34765 RepID=A0ABN7TDP5_OIKDI|nr:Oidioi.mRNA.OKI2018_I69.chr2.g6902.t1.cds [Oikopleura dioica]
MKTAHIYGRDQPLNGHSRSDPLIHFCSVLVKDNMFIIGGHLIREIRSGEQEMRRHSIRDVAPHLRRHSCSPVANDFIIDRVEIIFCWYF